MTQDLDATRGYLNKLKPVRSGEIGIIGFCWGGGQSFGYATNTPQLKAFVVWAMKAAGKDYPYTVYPGVGHGFLRTREKPEVADSAWNAAIRFFRAKLKS